MSSFATPRSSLASLESKVIVLTGGSSGIGAATTRLLHSLGAFVIFGDINASAAAELISSLPDSPYSRSNVAFLETDVRSYAANLALFELAESKHGHIDHAIADAGVSELDGWFGPSLTRETVHKCPKATTMDINLTAMLYFSRIAVAFLSDPKTRKKGDDRSITIMSSSAGFRAPRFVLYGTSKHGAVGLGKSLALGVGAERGIRVNVLMPWTTPGTGLEAGFFAVWEAAGLPVNQVGDVARVIRKLIASPDPSVTGKTIYIEDGNAWDINESQEKTTDAWWGPGMKAKYEAPLTNKKPVDYAKAMNGKGGSG